MTRADPRCRLFVETDLTDGAEFLLQEAQAHYLLSVMRLSFGGSVALFNGRQGEWHASLIEVGKKKARVRLLAQMRPQPVEPDLWLLFAAVKRGPMDLIVEKATELGVSRLQALFTERTIMSRVGEDRLRLIAIEAAEQCERLSVPDLPAPVSLPLVLASWPAERRLLMMDESGGGRPIAELLQSFPTGPAALLIGPEGGFAKSELDAVGRLAFATRVGLGRRILRADTAVIAALACYQAICGDWRENSP